MSAYKLCGYLRKNQHRSSYFAVPVFTSEDENGRFYIQDWGVRGDTIFEFYETVVYEGDYVDKLEYQDIKFGRGLLGEVVKVGDPLLYVFVLKKNEIAIGKMPIVW